MTSPITSASAASPTSAVQNKPAPKTPAPSAAASQPKDSVHLSAAALKASGDVDHDGDSH
jgi:hypothetical protein